MPNNTENVGMFDSLKSEVTKSEAPESEVVKEEVEVVEQASADDKNSEDAVEDSAGKVYTDEDLDAIVDKKLHKKISKMTRRDKEKNETIQQMQDRLAELEGRTAPKEAVKTLIDFDGDQEQYTDYLLEKKLNARVAAADDANQKRTAKQRQVEEVNEDIAERRRESFDALVTRIPEAGDIISNAKDVVVEQDVMKIIDDMDDVAGMLLMLAENPKDAAAINKGSDMVRAMKLAKLELKLETRQSKSTKVNPETVQAVAPVGDIMRNAANPSTTPSGGKNAQAMDKFRSNFGFN